jgi:hypothetical protein
MAGLSLGRSRVSSGSIVSDYERSGFDLRRRQRIFPPSSECRPALGPTQPPVKWVPGFLSPGVKRGRGMTLTTHPHLVPRSWMSRSYTSSPQAPSRRVAGLVYFLCRYWRDVSDLTKSYTAKLWTHFLKCSHTIPGFVTRQQAEVVNMLEARTASDRNLVCSNKGALGGGGEGRWPTGIMDSYA